MNKVRHLIGMSHDRGSHRDSKVSDKIVEGFLESFQKDVDSCEVHISLNEDDFYLDDVPVVENQDPDLNLPEMEEEEVTEIETGIPEFISELINNCLIQGIKSDQLKTIESEEVVEEEEEEETEEVQEIHDKPEEAIEVSPEIEDVLEPQDDKEDTGILSSDILNEIIDNILIEEVQLQSSDVVIGESGKFSPIIEVFNDISPFSLSGETFLDYEPSPESVLQDSSGVLESPDTQVDPEVLEPDNPLLARFQKALQYHLQRQLKRLNDDILNLKGEIKENDKKEETVSQKIYTIEIQLNQQQQRLKKLLEKIKETTSNWDSLMVMVTQLKADYNEKSQNLDALIKKDSELQSEVESLAALIQQFSEWEQKQSSELSSTKFLSERQEADKKKLFSEKQKLDLLLLSVRKDVLKYSRAFHDMKQHITDKTKELNIVEQTVADANADIEEMLCNNRKIMNLWAKNIVVISQKDKALLETQQSAEDHKLKYNTLEAEVEGTKKECNDLIKYNEKLTAKMVSEERFYDNIRRRLKDEIEKKRVLEENLSQAVQMKEFTESDLASSQRESDEIVKKINLVMDECAKAKAENNLIEEKIVNKLIEQATENKAAQSLNNSITEFKNLIREQEVAIADFENRIAKVMVETEKHRMSFECSDLQLKTVDNEIHEKEMKIKSLKNELERTIFTGQQTKGEIDKNVRKLEKLKEAKGDCELSPEEIKIRELEKKISDLDEESAEQQQFWIRQENHIVSISQKRTDQLEEISVLRKQLIILDKKNMMIENEINSELKERRNYLSTKEALQKKLVKFNEQFIKKKGYKEELDNCNLHIQNKYVADLKDAEDATIALQNEINDLDGQKKELYDKISQQQKDVLAWEKKLQMAVETRQLIETLHADGGELANMKNEIHRMEIRYSQLQKAQEKLAHDMELSVSRRDGIVDATLAREKHVTKGGMHYTKLQYAKKMEELKQNIRQTVNELNNVNKEAYLCEKKKKDLEEQLNLKNDQLLALKKATEQMDIQLAEGHLHRQKNLETLVRLQRKCRLYHDIKTSQYKLLYRNESGLEMENQRLKTIKSDLASIIESLVNDFPSLQMLLTAIRNTLQVDS